MSKLTIMNTKPTISDDEIRSRMDFSGLLNDQKVAEARLRTRNRTFRIVGCITSILLITGSYYFFKETRPETKQTAAVLPAQQAPAEPAGNSATSVAQDSANIVPPVTNQKKKNTSTELAPAPDKDDATAVVESGYKEAEPIDGFPALYAYFDRELKYPQDAVKDSIQGIITVAFVLKKDGKPDQIKVVNSMGPAFDEEALRLITHMPAWKAATLNGKAIASKITLPLTFRYKKVTH